MYFYLPVWKGPRFYHENALIIADYPRISPMISMDTVKKFYAAALHNTLRRFTGIQFTLSLTAEGNDRPEQ